VSLVVDASLTLSWYFEDERTTEADAVLDRLTESGAVVPALWHLEVANGFQIAIRRKRIDADFRDRAIRQLAMLPITADTETGVFAWTTTLALADRFGLTIYDACYLELAQRREAPLATLDQDLRDAGRALGVELLGLAGQ
jgi:predicted nucleic acid-binding protein